MAYNPPIHIYIPLIYCLLEGLYATYHLSTGTRKKNWLAIPKNGWNWNTTFLLERCYVTFREGNLHRSPTSRRECLPFLWHDLMHPKWRRLCPWWIQHSNPWTKKRWKLGFYSVLNKTGWLVSSIFGIFTPILPKGFMIQFDDCAFFLTSGWIEKSPTRNGERWIYGDTVDGTKSGSPVEVGKYPTI